MPSNDSHNTASLMQYGALTELPIPSKALTTINGSRNSISSSSLHHHHAEEEEEEEDGLSSKTILTIALILVITLGSANNIIYKIMFNAYGSDEAFFVSTGVNFLYILYGGCLLYPRMLWTRSVTKEMTQLPKHRFVVMGFLDCLGTFAAAMGAVYTPGQVQTLLNQTLIPVTMGASVFFLGTRFYKVQLLGASLVLFGAIVVVLPSFIGHQQQSGLPTESRWYANLIFFASNIPVAFSQVYKENTFKADKIDVIYLTQWVSIFQFFFGLALAPLQVVPGVGSEEGISLPEIWSSFVSGWNCWLEMDDEGGQQQQCRQRHTFLLLTGFCLLNVIYNTAGLYVSKHGSAVLSAITYGVILPITTVLFCVRPLLGQYTEQLHVATIIGLVIVVIGFYIYQSPVLKKEAKMRRRASQRGREAILLLSKEEGSDGGRPTSLLLHSPSPRNALLPPPGQHPEKQEEGRVLVAYEEKEEEEAEEEELVRSMIPSFQERVVMVRLRPKRHGFFRCVIN